MGLPGSDYIGGTNAHVEGGMDGIWPSGAL